MELFDLEFSLDQVASAGNTLNIHEITGLRSGLTKLKCDEKFTNIYFWGKVFGKEAGDYYIAYGLRPTEFEFPQKKFYYAGESFAFSELPLITEAEAEEIISLCSERMFEGKPDAPLKAATEAGEGATEGAEEGVKVLTEIDHLAQVVQEIDFDTAVVPKGAYSISEEHQVVPSIDFKGLSNMEAASLTSYLHFRPPISIAKLRALARDDVQFYANFLDPLEEDLPMGCWAIRQEPSATLVSVRSLNWPGYIGFHVPGTPKFGSCYFGYAQKNRDLPFLL